MHPSCYRPVAGTRRHLLVSTSAFQATGRHLLGCIIPQAVKHSLALLRIRKKLPETCWADWNVNKLLLLHLVGLLHYLYQWCRSNKHQIYLYRVSQEECARLREGVPYVKVYRYNPKHLCPNLNGYGDNGQRKVWSSFASTHCFIPADSLWPCVWRQITTSQQR